MRRLVLSTVGFAVLLAGVAIASSESAARPVSTGAATVTGYIAYVRVRGEVSWITVADLAGRGRHEITRPPGKKAPWFDHSPVWSPDGSRLAFVREGRSGSGLYVANRDGSGLRRVLGLPNVGYYGSASLAFYDGSDFSWSPDGQRLAFAYGPLYVVNRDDTTNRKPLTSFACKPSWSTDARSLVYLVDDDCRSDRGSNEWVPGYRAVYRIDADGSHRRQLAFGSFGDASWSPDGRQIAITDRCAVGHGGDWGCSVSLMKTDGSGKHRLVKGTYGSGEWGVEWTAGGTEVLWPSGPTFQATNVATGKTHRVLPVSYKKGYLGGISASGQRIAVLATSSYEMRESHPIPRLIIVTASGRLVQRVTAPRGWRSVDASVYLR